MVLAFFRLEVIGQKQSFIDSLESKLEAKSFSNSYEEFQIHRSLARTDKERPLQDRIRLMNRAVDLAEEIDSTLLCITSLNELASYQWQQGNPDASVKTLFRMAEKARKNGFLLWEGHGYANLAQNHRMLQEYATALRYELQALEIYEAKSDTLLIFNSRQLLADIYFRMQQYQKAESYVASATAFYKPGLQAFEFVKSCLLVIKSLLTANKGEFKLAEEEFNQADNFLRNFDLGASRALWKIDFSKIYLEQGRPGRAIYWARLGYQAGVDNGYKEVIRNGAEVLAEAFEIKGQLDSSLYFFKEYHAFRDSIVNIENVKEIEAMRADFSIAQKQSEVDLVLQQKRNRQVLIIALGVIALLFVIFTISFYRAAQKRKKLNAELAALNHTKDKFFSIISHDLRGPVGAFNGISMLIRGYLEEKSYSELKVLSDHIEKSAGSLSELLDNLLNWALQQQGSLPFKQVNFDLKQVLENCLEIFRSSAATKKISLVLDCDKSAFILADKDMVMTIFRNLTGNALKFTKSGGKVALKTMLEDGYVSVAIQDDGIGMSQEQQASLFKLNANRSYGTAGESGLGVGLQLVHEFVTLNQGTITVASEEQKGSTFVVNFPLVSEVEAISI
ncbi:MAG: tetratricopeptide repeat-containing sensor histidine kinase [Bacteroidota bacterium]